MSPEKKELQPVVDVKNQVSGPAIGLLVAGIIGGMFSLVTLISLGIGLGFSTFWVRELPKGYSDLYEGAFGMGGFFVGVLVAAFVIFAALKMKDLTQWSLAVAASILVMIPCISPCCLIGLPVGIWSLVVLMRPEVKAAFH